MPLLDRDEPRFAEATREMRQSGNIVVPTFNNEPRYAKPPLIYWCQAISFTLFGENAFAARLPSLLATAVTAWLLFVWCVRLGSVEIGFSAAVSYALCFQALQQGRVATADAALIFFMTLTAFAGWKLMASPPVSHSTRNYFWDSMLALGFAGGFLAKGPEAFLPLLPLLYGAWGMRKNLVAEIVVDFVIGVAIVLFWAIPAYVETHGDYWKVGLGHDVIDRMAGGDFQGHGASTIGWYLLGLFYYLLLFWLSALPWSPLLVTQRKKLFGGWKPDAIDLYLLLNAGLIFLVFTFMVTKLPHYTLPAFPFLALCFARRWHSVGLSPHFLTRLGWRMGIIFALVALGGIPIAMHNDATPSPVRQLVREARGVLTPETKFAVVDYQEPNVIWEMRRVVKGYGKSISESEVVDFLKQPGPHAVVLSSALWKKGLAKSDPTALVSNDLWLIYSAHGFNAAKLSSLDLTLVVKP
jgi:4-amino-4-deoxy-L-arabinose transferase-like glycosyltransferase